ncbi:MAG: radical SAM protein, partial [Polyangiaceae bacterium]|nr:radical SAM protein [Polyangiaceae bacterium]
ALSVLTAFLRARGWDAHQWDLGIEAFHHFHCADHVRRCREALRELGCDDELNEVAVRVEADIEGAKQALRTPGIGADHERMRWALHTIRDAGIVLTATSGGNWEHHGRNFAVPGAMTSFEHLEQACTDPNRNPFVDFVRSRVVARLQRDRPSAIGVSISYLSQLIPALTLIRAARSHFPHVPIIVGGAYLTATSYELESVPYRTMPADAIVAHDGEAALQAWLCAVLRHERPAETANLYLPDGDRFRRSAEGLVVQTDLDETDGPMWTSDGLDLDQYLVPKYPIALPLSRGCYWGRCAYCNISSQTSGSYRRRSVEKSIGDIKAAMREARSNWFDFPVDSFRPRELLELARAIVAEGLKIEWGAEVLLDAEFRGDVLSELAASGCRCLRFGLESACSQTLRAMNKSSKPSVARRILGDCRAFGIRTAVMLIVGFPSETRAGLEETFDFLVDNRDRIDFLTLHRYSLVIGSPMAHDPGAYGLFLKPQRPVFAPNLPFVNTNPGGMQEEHIDDLIAAMRESLREHYPDHGELWTVGIGGWMTFASCCEHDCSASIAGVAP